MDDQRVKDIAELTVRRYFDHYLEDVFPIQVAAMIRAHNLDPRSHGSVERKVSRFAWMLVGGATVVGAGFGSLATKLISIL